MEYRLTFEEYQQGLERGKFLALKCGNCGTYTFPPQGACSNCRDKDMTVTEIKGDNGIIRTYTVIRVSPEGMEAPYVIAMVELEEGPWVIGNLVDIDVEKTDMSLMGRKVRLGSHFLKRDPDPGNDYRVLTFSLV